MILASIAQVLPVGLGISPDMTAACFCLWKAQVGMMHDLIANEYLIQRKLQHLVLTPGAQYRRHIKSIGGLRC